MKNTLQTDSKVSALEAFHPSNDDMLESLSLEQLVESFGGYMTAPKRMSYVIVRATTGQVFATAEMPQEMCFFYSVKMFQNHRWLERATAGGFECVRADIYAASPYIQPKRPGEWGEVSNRDREFASVEDERNFP